MQLVDPCTYRDWNEQVLTMPQASIFHSIPWLRVVQASYGYRPYYFVGLKGQQLTALLPFMEVKSWLTGIRGVSLPFSDYCEPIRDETTSPPEVLEHVVQVARQQQWKFLEMRGGEALWRGITPVTFYYRHLLALHKDEAQLFSKLRSNYRVKIKKARAHDLTATICHSPEAMTEYYRLHCLTRKRQGLPPQPAFFFKYIQEYIVAKNFGFVTLVSHKGRNIAGAVFFSFGHQAIYKFGASERSYQSLLPNYFLFWHVIQWLCRHNYTELCFGRSDPHHTGLIQFKDGWGAHRSKINYYKYDLGKLCFIQKERKTSRYSGRVWQKMPITILKLAGSILYKHLG